MPILDPKHISPYATEYEPSLRVRNGDAGPRKGKPRFIVFHTTGSGPYTTWVNNPTKFANPFRVAVNLYATSLPYSPHYVVGSTSGLTLCMSPEDLVSWGVSSSGWEKYKDPKWAESEVYEWWKHKWPDLTSPIDLANGTAWQSGSVNDGAVHIEVPPSQTDARPIWSDECMKALRLLCSDICARWDIPFSKYTILIHSDVTPLTRTTDLGRPWDPHTHQYSFARLMTF